MITLQQWMELVNFRITEGSDYTWSCYGNRAHELSSWNGVHGAGGYSLNVVFSTKSQRVFEVSVCDYTNDRAYRLIAENKREKHRKEAGRWSSSPDEAWDDVNYVDLETDEDFMEKARAIVAGKDYDTRVSIPVDFTDEELLKYAKMAHEQDITLNQFIENALRAMIDEYKLDPEGVKARAEIWKAEHDIA
jgi:hypothetical protein